MDNILRGVAQLGLERLLGVQEIGGSNPLTPIKLGARHTGGSPPKIVADPSTRVGAIFGRTRRRLVAGNPLTPIKFEEHK